MGKLFPSTWIILLAMTASLQAATIVWEGDTNNNWTNIGNWTGGVLPANDTTTDIAQFGAGTYASGATPRTPTIDAVRSVGGLNVLSGASALAFAVNNTFTVGSSGIALASNTTFNVNNSITMTVQGGITGANSLVKTGNGLLDAQGGLSTTGSLDLNNGTFKGSIANVNLRFNSSSRTAAYLITSDFTNSLGSGTNQIRWTATTGGGGLAASGGNRIVNLGGSGATLTWGSTANFVSNDRVLVFGSPFADSTLIWQNPIDLGTSGINYRELSVTNGTTPGIYAASITGVISSSGASGPKDIIRLNGGTSIADVSNGQRVGTGTLAFSATNTYTGATIIDTGTLVANATLAIPNAVYVGSSAANLNGSPAFGVLRSDVANGIGGPIFVASGATAKAANLDLSRVQLSPLGALQFDNAGDLPATGQIKPNVNGAVLATGTNLAIDQSFLNKIDPSFRGVVGIGSNSSNNLDFNSAGLTNARFSAWSSNPGVSATSQDSITYSGTITPSGNTYRLGGGNAILVLTQPLTGSNNLEVSFSDFWQAMAAITPSGSYRANVLPSRVTLTAANNLTGTVEVGRGQVLRLEGSNGSLSSASAININGGQFRLEDAASASNNNRLPDSAPLNFTLGGQFQYIGTGGQTENAGAINLQPGMSHIILSRGTGTGNAVIQFDSLSRVKGTMAQFSSSSTTVQFDTAPTVGANNRLGGWALSGESNFATYSGTGFGGLGTYNSGLDSTWVAGDAVQIATARTMTANRTIDLLRNITGANTLTQAGYTLTINSGGIAAAESLTLTGGSLTAGIGTNSSYELFTSAANGKAINIRSTITDNGGNPVALVRGNAAGYTNGGYDLNLYGNNTYSGGTYVMGGRTSGITVGHANALGIGPVYCLGTPQLDINNWNSLNQTNNFTFDDPNASMTVANAFHIYSETAFALNGSEQLTLTGGITLYNGATLNGVSMGGGMRFEGPISGDGNLRLNAGVAFMQGTQANSYSGVTSVYSSAYAAGLYLNKTAGVDAIPAGGLLIGSPEAGTGTKDKIVQWQQSNQVNDAATITFFGDTSSLRAIARLDRYSETISGLISVPGAGIVENTNATTASTLTISPGEGKSYSFGGLIRNGGTAALAIIKEGLGTQEITGPNTFTGGFTLNAGTVIANGGVASSVQSLATTNSSNLILVSDTAGLFVGQSVTGTGIAAGTTIAAIATDHSIRLSANATATATNDITFGAGSPLGLGTVTIGANGTLSGSAYIASALTLNGTIAPGNSPGILTIGNDAVLNSSATLQVELNSTILGTGYDQLALSGSNRTLTLNDPTLEVLLGFTPDVGDSFTIVSGFTNLIGEFDGLPDDASFQMGQVTFQVQYNPSEINLLVTMVPEPTTVAGLIGLGTLLLALLRRKSAARIC